MRRHTRIYTRYCHLSDHTRTRTRMWVRALVVLRLSLTDFLPHTYIYICQQKNPCICVCVCSRARLSTHLCMCWSNIKCVLLTTRKILMLTGSPLKEIKLALLCLHSQYHSPEIYLCDLFILHSEGRLTRSPNVSIISVRRRASSTDCSITYDEVTWSVYRQFLSLSANWVKDNNSHTAIVYTLVLIRWYRGCAFLFFFFFNFSFSFVTQERFANLWLM